ncbi:hypothetical protein [Labrys neptuniae]
MGDTQGPFKPHPANSAGGFYVVDQCCITCGVPLIEAPEVFAWADESPYASCIVARQPQTSVALSGTLSAIKNAEVDCIRYRGSDPDIGRRLVEMGAGAQCDQPPPSDAKPLVRSHATFRAKPLFSAGNPAELAQNFLSHFVRSKTDPPFTGAGTKTGRSTTEWATVQVAWSRGIYHAVDFEYLGDGIFHIVTTATLEGAGIGLSQVVESWLCTCSFVDDIRWFSTEQWQNGGPYLVTVV